MGAHITRDDVIAAYRLILERDPESEAAIEHHSTIHTWHELVASLMQSDEYRRGHSGTGQSRPDIQVYSGYSESDLAIFNNFPQYQGTGKPGFVIDFLGTKTRVAFSTTFTRLSGQVFGYPVPMDFHAEAIEWFGFLKSVLSAGDQLCVLELGAGWGPWLSAAAAACRVRGIRKYRLYGVEADAGHVEFIHQHLSDNGISKELYEIISGVVAPNPGTCKWPVTREAAGDYGQSLLMSEHESAYATRFTGFAEMNVIGINDILAREPSWDIVHMDIQGLEGQVCEAGMEELSRRVRWLIIGTHSRKIDGDLVELLNDAGWYLEHEKPARFRFDPSQPSLEAMTIADGTQVWRNPRARVES